MTLHAVEQLRVALRLVKPYPLGVTGVPRPIRGTAFFPGGFGLWRPEKLAPLPPMPVGGVMVLGQDFHSRRNYERSLELGCSTRNPTWRNLLPLLKSAGIAPHMCFFTNAYMGLREGDRSIGRFPGANDDSFTERCRRFFLLQLRAHRPELILILGKRVPHFLAPLSVDLSAWTGCKTMRDIDCAGPVLSSVRFTGFADHACHVAVLTHPSILGSNLARRCFGNFRGRDAELAMIRTIYLTPRVRAANRWP